ncbi:MAG: ATP-dependent DNA ligase, partial [Planctomycetota bacterium]
TAMVFDLDPGEPATLLDCAGVAIELRQMLRDVQLESYAKTSGGKGLHLYVPLNTDVTFEHTKAFSQAMALLAEQAMPRRVVARMAKHLRAGKVYVDWAQNERFKSTVCVYSLRARSRPTVSTPVTWEEVQSAWESRDASRLVFETADVLRRVRERGDVWKNVLHLGQDLPAV